MKATMKDVAELAGVGLAGHPRRDHYDYQIFYRAAIRDFEYTTSCYLTSFISSPFHLYVPPIFQGHFK